MKDFKDFIDAAIAVCIVALGVAFGMTLWAFVFDRLLLM